MNFSRPLLLLLAMLLGAGCAVTPLGRPAYLQPYHKVIVTDLQGVLVAEWIAEGPVAPRGNGYRFAAVQRLSAPPYPVLSRYPHGRRVLVTGPNITVAPIGKPEWLRRVDGF